MIQFMELPANNNEFGAWSNGTYRCLACKFEQHATAPVGWVFIDCPCCGTERFTNKYTYVKSDTVFTCKCGCDVFSITPSRLFCPNCGQDHRPFDQPTDWEA